MRILLATLNVALRNAARATLESAGHIVRTIPANDDESEENEPFTAELVIMDDTFPQHADRHDLDLIVTQMMNAKLLYLRSTNLDAANDDPRNGTTDSPDTATDAGMLSQIDDELRKPFSDSELLAHVRMLSRTGVSSGSSILTRGDLTLDVEARRAFYGRLDRPIPLSPREYAALEMMVRADGDYLSFEELLEGVCGNGFFEQRDVMMTVMRSLERKLHQAGLFMTQRGDRYRIG